MVNARQITSDFKGDHLSPKMLGGRANDGTDATAALQAIVDSVWQRTTTTRLINDGMDRGGVVIDLVGCEYTISAPITVPSGAGGNVIFQNGAIKASAAFPTDKFLLDFTSSGNRGRITFQNLTLDANHRGGCLNLGTPWAVTLSHVFCRGYASTGIKATGGADLLLSHCRCFEFIWNETGFDDPAAHSGRAVEIRASDTHIEDLIIGPGKEGMMLGGGDMMVSHFHAYNLSSWPLYLTAWTDCVFLNPYFDLSAPIVAETPWRITMRQPKWLLHDRPAYLIRIAPQAPNVGSGAMRITGAVADLGNTYYAPSGTLTLSSAAIGPTTITNSASYFSAAMVGSSIVVLATGGGIAVINGYTSPTQVSAYVVVPFSSTTLATWWQRTSLLYFDETAGSVGTTGPGCHNFSNNALLYDGTLGDALRLPGAITDGAIPFGSSGVGDTGSYTTDPAHLSWDPVHYWLGVGKPPIVPLDVQSATHARCDLYTALPDALTDFWLKTLSDSYGLALDTDNKLHFRRGIGGTPYDFGVSDGWNWDFSGHVAGDKLIPGGASGPPIRAGSGYPTAGTVAGELFLRTDAPVSLYQYDGSGWGSMVLTADLTALTTRVTALESAMTGKASSTHVHAHTHTHTDPQGGTTGGASVTNTGTPI